MVSGQMPLRLPAAAGAAPATALGEGTRDAAGAADGDAAGLAAADGDAAGAAAGDADAEGELLTAGVEGLGAAAVVGAAVGVDGAGAQPAETTRAVTTSGSDERNHRESDIKRDPREELV